MCKICPKVEFILEMIFNIEEVIKRHQKISLALNDIEGQGAILMFLMQIGETLHKIDKLKSDIIENYNLKTETIGSYNVRNFIAHDYEGVNLTLIDMVLRDNLPILKNKLQKLKEDKCPQQ